MTVWVGGIPLLIKQERTIVDFLSSVPGLDVIYPEKASVGQLYASGAVKKRFLVLSPVSLVMAKLHALTAFDQKDRQDRLHLEVSLTASRGFLRQLLEQGEIRMALWNIERLLGAGQYPRNRKLEITLSLTIDSAVPIQEIEQALAAGNLPKEDRRRLDDFLNIRWKRSKPKSA